MHFFWCMYDFFYWSWYENLCYWLRRLVIRAIRVVNACLLSCCTFEFCRNSFEFPFHWSSNYWYDKRDIYCNDMVTNNPLGRPIIPSEVVLWCFESERRQMWIVLIWVNHKFWWFDRSPWRSHLLRWHTCLNVGWRRFVQQQPNTFIVWSWFS